MVKTNRYYHCCMDSLDDGYSPQPDVSGGRNVCVSGNNNTNEILLMRPNYTLLGGSGPVLHCLLQQHDEIKQIFKHTGMGSTGRKKISTYYGKYTMYLKLQPGHFLNFTTLSLNLATDEVIVWFTSTISMSFSGSLCNKFCLPHILSTWKNPTTSSACNISKRCIVTVLYNSN